MGNEGIKKEGIIYVRKEIDGRGKNRKVERNK
jgi:hypothetical protein